MTFCFLADRWVSRDPPTTLGFLDPFLNLKDDAPQFALGVRRVEFRAGLWLGVHDD
jgi:hypothetical protein